MRFIDIKGLNIKKGSTEILKDINLNFDKGKLYGVLGANGAGKSTLFKAITNQEKIHQGSILIDNKELNTYSIQELAKNISLMSQNFSLKFPYSVEEIVSMGRFPYSGGYLNKEDMKEINKAIAETDLEGIRGRRVDQLSGGEKQRVLFAKTLCQNTQAILIDEGFSNMDIYYQIELIRLLKNKSKKENKLIIFIMHDLALAKKYCDNILMLRFGQVHSFGNCEEVLNDKALYEVFRVKARFTDSSLEFL